MSRTERRTLNQRGFTLLELLVIIMIVGILSLTVANFIIGWLQTSSLAQARASLLTNAQAALDNVSDDIRLSGGADGNNRWPDTYAPGNEYGWQSNGSTLVLARVATSSTKDVIYSDPVQYVTEKDNVVYYVSGKKLYQRIIAAGNPSTAAITSCPPVSATPSCPADKKIAEDVTAFSITYYNADDQVVPADEARAVQLGITISQQKGGEQVEATYTTRMVFRNE